MNEALARTTAIVIFVKTPGLSPLKTRLAETVGVEDATAIYLKSLKGVEASVCKALEAHPKATVFWAVAEEAGLTSPFWSSFKTTYQGEGDLAPRIGRIFNRFKESHDSVILLGGDTPHIPSEWIANSIKDLENETEPLAVFGPAADGGFYLFGANFKSAGITLGSIEYSMSTTLDDLAEQLFSTCAFSWLPQLTDIDRESDLLQVGQEILKNRELLLPEQVFIEPHGKVLNLT